MKTIRILILGLCAAAAAVALLELVLFQPKADVLRGAAQARETRGTIVTVDLDARTVSEYRRALVLPCYRAGDRYAFEPDDRVTGSVGGWYDTCLYVVDPQSGHITVEKEKPRLQWLLFWFCTGCLMIHGHRLWRHRAASDAVRKESES